MKYLLLGDTHLRYQIPRGRCDNFFKAQYDKMKQVFEIYRREKCTCILQAGDLFDSPTVSQYVLTRYLELFSEYGIGRNDFFTIMGQHDMHYRSQKSKERTATRVMEAAGALRILTKTWLGRANVVGLEWGAPLSLAAALENSADYNILVTHRMVGSEPLFPGHRIDTPRGLVELIKEKTSAVYDLILCGDYHYPFVETVGKTLVVNTGCLMRMTRAERDMSLRPQVCVWNTEHPHAVKKFVLNVAPAEDVFIADGVQIKDTDSRVQRGLHNFVTALHSDIETRADFLRIVKTYMAEKEDISQSVLEVLEEVLTDG